MSKEKRETPLNISLSKETKAKLKGYAANQGMSTSELFRKALQEKFDREGVDINVSDGVEKWGRHSEKDSEE